MKTKALHFSLLIISFLFFSFSDPYSIKRISDKDFRYEFYTISKVIKPKNNKIYYWFKGGVIHNAQSGIAGELLNDKFVKMHHSNQLAEQGFFKKGLKVGLWKTWYQSGMIETTQKWSNGIKSGSFYNYNENGELIQKGKYKNNKKNGTWIDYIKKDTIVYKNGIIFVKKTKLPKEEKAKKKEEKQIAETAKTASQKDSKPEEKKNFFKRLFNTKESKNKLND